MAEARVHAERQRRQVVARDPLAIEDEAANLAAGGRAGAGRARKQEAHPQGPNQDRAGGAADDGGPALLGRNQGQPLGDGGATKLTFRDLDHIPRRSGINCALDGRVLLRHLDGVAGGPRGRGNQRGDRDQEQPQPRLGGPRAGGRGGAEQRGMGHMGWAPSRGGRAPARRTRGVHQARTNNSPEYSRDSCGPPCAARAPDQVASAGGCSTNQSRDVRHVGLEVARSREVQDAGTTGAAVLEIVRQAPGRQHERSRAGHRPSGRRARCSWCPRARRTRRPRRARAPPAPSCWVPTTTPRLSTWPRSRRRRPGIPRAMRPIGYERPPPGGRKMPCLVMKKNLARRGGAEFSGEKLPGPTPPAVA